MYNDYQGHGIGTMLPEHVKRQPSVRLPLFTFVRTRHARWFYESHGFRMIGQGFEEKWGLKDIEYA